MRLRKILFLLILLLLSGCSVDYNLDISSEGVFKETIIGTISGEEYSNLGGTDVNPYQDILNYSTPLIEDNGYYDKEIIDVDGNKEYYFTYTFNNNYQDSSVINSCYDNVLFEENDEVYYIKLTGEFKCLYSDKVTVNVYTEHNVYDHNADEINETGNIYTWTIDNKNDADIFMMVSKYPEIILDEKKPFMNSFKAVVFVILLILSVIVYFLYKKVINKNERDI